MLPSFLMQWLDRPQGEEWEFISSFCLNGLPWGHTFLSHSGSSGPILYNKNVPLPLLLLGSLASQPCLPSALLSLSSHLVACPYFWVSPTHDHIQPALLRKPDCLESTQLPTQCGASRRRSVHLVYLNFLLCLWTAAEQKLSPRPSCNSISVWTNSRNCGKRKAFSFGPCNSRQWGMTGLVAYSGKSTMVRPGLRSIGFANSQFQNLGSILISVSFHFFIF